MASAQFMLSSDSRSFRFIALESFLLDTSSSDFLGLAEDGVFVDKSLALEEFLDRELIPLHLLLRPRRSGKTILLNMFRLDPCFVVTSLQLTKPLATFSNPQPPNNKPGERQHLKISLSVGGQSSTRSSGNIPCYIWTSRYVTKWLLFDPC